MKRDLVIRGSTVDEKFASIDKVLESYRRRLSQYVIGAVPPIPVFCYTAEPELVDGVVLRYLCPMSGVITRGGLFAETMKEKYSVEIKTDGVAGQPGTSYSFNADKTTLLVRPDLNLPAGSRLLVKVNPPTALTGVWIGFTFEVKFNDLVKEEIAIDKFLRLSEDERV